jgi:hypothetical protein
MSYQRRRKRPGFTVLAADSYEPLRTFASRDDAMAYAKRVRGVVSGPFMSCDEAMPCRQRQPTVSRFKYLLVRQLVPYLRSRLAADQQINLGAIIQDVSAKTFRQQKGDLVLRLSNAMHRRQKLAMDSNVDNLIALLDALEGSATPQNDQAQVPAQAMKQLAQGSAGPRKRMPFSMPMPSSSNPQGPSDE